MVLMRWYKSSRNEPSLTAACTIFTVLAAASRSVAQPIPTEDPAKERAPPDEAVVTFPGKRLYKRGARRPNDCLALCRSYAGARASLFLGVSWLI